jgi:lactate dehydrogenase-like 2-hydroxyacid dehydrogenase
MSSKPGVLISGDITPHMRDKLAAHFTLHQLPEEAERAAFFERIAPDCIAGAAYGPAGFPKSFIDALPGLKIISCYGVGYDAIDADTAASRGIVVTHTPNVLNDEVANTAILLWLATARRLAAYDAYVRAGRWESEGNPPLTQGTQNRTVGIVGMGRIGQAIADRLPVFGARILYHGRTKRDLPYDFYPDLVEMAAACDVLIVITPGGPATRHLISAEVMNALGPEGILVNVARGTVVDEPALISALEEGRLGAAGLDVFENEPHVPEALRAMEQVVLQPHVGSATETTRRAMGDLTCDNLLAFLEDGTVLTPVPECAAFARKREASGSGS